MLNTKLEHLTSREEIADLLKNNQNVMVCCGRMGPMCIPVYWAMEKLQNQYPHVTLRDMEFDIPAAEFIKGLSECVSFMGLPFTVYFRDGKVVKATSSIQSEKQVIAILNTVFKR
jgi:thioredoxin 1